MNNEISFKSKINFVQEVKWYNDFRKGTNIDFRVPAKAFQKAGEFFTEEVRTCTAGGFINSKTGEAAGFHYYDGETGYNNIENFVNMIFKSINPDRCLLLGSNDLKCAPFSVASFRKFKEIFTERMKNVTIFEQHVFPWSESNLHYSSCDDRWDIYTMFRPLTDYKEHSVSNAADLQQCFKKIIISDGDVLTFG